MRIKVRYFLFWDVTQLRLLVITDVPGQPIGAIFKGQEIQKEAVPKRQWITTNLRCITSQKNEDLTYTAKVACNHALILLLILNFFREINKTSSAIYLGYSPQPYSGSISILKTYTALLYSLSFVKGKMCNVNIVLKY